MLYETVLVPSSPAVPRTVGSGMFLARLASINVRPQTGQQGLEINKTHAYANSWLTVTLCDCLVLTILK